MDNLQSVSLNASLIEEAKAVTGKRTPQAAIKALLESTRVPQVVQESECDFRRGKFKAFSKAAKAMKWLKS